jgi:alpha-mannosidase
MWIEPDCNILSGESLVRQLVHGIRWWQGKFGERGVQRYLYLPDTFGFPASLPQIAKLAGLDTFITTKLSWNETNEFPEANFRWRGIDGTEVLAHCCPGQDYNATTAPGELLRGEKNAARMDRSRAGVWLQPFGHGDGGGGPTDWAVEYARLAGDCEGLPQVVISRVDDFCEELHKRRREHEAQGWHWPVWDGELYLELHRGTFTTCAWLKRANRRAEQRLRLAELLSCAGPQNLGAGETKDASALLDEAWKLLLLNQFHDTLPGTSIAEVYDDARRQLARVGDISDALIEAAFDTWSGQVDTVGGAEPLLVFNPSAFNRSGVVESDGELHCVDDVPALGVAVMDGSHGVADEPVEVGERTLSNGLITATIDDAGRVSSLRHAESQRDACARRPDGSNEPINQLVLYDDRPRAWEAWDVDPEYLEKAYRVDHPVDGWTVTETGPLRSSIEVSRRLGRRSRITQRYTLEAGSPRLDIHTKIEWHEERRVLRALFPVNVRARKAVYEIQFGHIERPTHRNTSWDRAMFEVCAHRWMDLSEPGFGVALLNDCKYGHSCDGNVMGLSLLRSPKFPDPQVDMGEHEFTYSLMPHNGDWRAAGVDRQAEALNEPLLVRALPVDQSGPVKGHWSPLTLHVQGAAGISVSAIKRAEADDRLIVRLVETHGGSGEVTLDWHLPVGAVECFDLLERPMAAVGFAHDASKRRTTIHFGPFQIITLAAQRD